MAVLRPSAQATSDRAAILFDADRNAFGYCDGGIDAGGEEYAATAAASDPVGVELTGAHVARGVCVADIAVPARER